MEEEVITVFTAYNAHDGGNYIVYETEHLSKHMTNTVHATLRIDGVY